MRPNDLDFFDKRDPTVQMLYTIAWNLDEMSNELRALRETIEARQ